MKRTLVSLFMMLASALFAAEQASSVPLFNGHDFSGWVNVNCAPETWSIRDGMIHCTGHPTGALRTTRQYENFILDLDWRHLTSGGNSGVFIWASPIAAPGAPFLRGIEVQVLDNGFNVPGKNEWYTTHGDVFPIHGATMTPTGRTNGKRSFPSEDRSKSSPEWNHYRIVCTNGVIRLHVNGKEVSVGKDCNYRKGYLGLESEGAPIDFRNVRITELPSTDAPSDVTAPLDLGWRTLFNGLDLRGWNTNQTELSRWSVQKERITLTAGPQHAKDVLWTTADFGNAEFILDCLASKPVGDKLSEPPSVVVRGHDGQGVAIKLEGYTPGKFQRFVLHMEDGKVRLSCNEKETLQLTLPAGTPKRGLLGLVDAGNPLEFMNLYARDL